MYGEEKALKSVCTKIAIALLLLVLFFNIYSVAYLMRDELVSLFDKAIWLDCVSDIFCSLLYFLSFALPAGIFYALLKKENRIPIDFSMTLPSPNSLFKTLAILFVSIGTIVAISYFNAWLMPSSSSGAALVENSEPYELVLLVFSSAVVPAFAEELFFRGVVATHLKPYGKGFAVLASAFLFGAMHMNFSQLLYATAAGVILGVVYMCTNSLWLCILIHFGNNLFNVLESYMFHIFRVEQANLICMLSEVVLFALGILFALCYVLSAKKEKETSRKIGVFGEANAVEKKPIAITQQKLRAFFCPMMIVYLAVALVNMVYVLLAQSLM